MENRGAGRRGKTGGPGIPSPAPAELRLIQDLINTRDPAGKEQLSDPGVLADWLASQGLVAVGLELSAADHQRVLAFREGLRGLLAAGVGVDLATLERINRAATGARVQVRFGPGGVPRIDASAAGLDDAFGRWLGVLFNAHIEGLLIRLKICPNPACRTLFFDHSRSHARRWCTKRCGDALRARAYRRTGRYRRIKGRR